MQPLFSIVIANYNYGRFLGTAIQSVFDQCGGGEEIDVELIICDAASTDDSVSVIRRYAGALPPKAERAEEDWHGCRVTWWCSEKDKGQSDAFNKGFAHAHGRFLTWLNADDVLMPGALRAVAEEIRRHPACEWFVGSSVYADKNLRLTRWFRNHRFSPLRARLGFLTCGGPSSFFTRRLFDEAGGMDVDLHFLMDIDLWYRFFSRCQCCFRRTTAPVFAYRIHEDSKMSGADVEQSEKALRNRRRAQDELGLLCRRYRIPGAFVRQVATVLSFSLVDKIVSKVLELRHRGKQVLDV